MAFNLFQRKSKFQDDFLMEGSFLRFFDLLGTPENIQETVNVFQILEPDVYLTKNIELFKERIERKEPFWEMCCVLNLWGKVFRPTRYLEIGMRRGRSVSQVAFQNPTCEITGFDAWDKNYSGVENPGPNLVRAELKKVGHEGPLELIEGNSHETLPAFFAAHKHESWDVITVDGDHSVKGAKRDLLDVVDYVKPCGMLLFDDIIHEKFELDKVWRWFKRRYDKRFHFVENWNDMHGTAMAIRRPSC